MSNVSQLYNALFSFEAGKRQGAYPIHKNLHLDVRYSDLLDWLLDKVKFSPDDHILDAGCGTGYSLIKLATEKGVSGKGISLAEQEISFASIQVNDLELGPKVQFEVATFEEDITGNYNKILAIESIKHSSNFEAVLSNLAGALHEKGALIIADDFVLQEESQQLKKHKKYWQVPGFDKRERTINFLNRMGFQVDQFELTQFVPRRSEWLLDFLLSLVGLILRIIPKQYRLKLEIYLGGLILEQLYNHGQVGYYVLIAQKEIQS